MIEEHKDGHQDPFISVQYEAYPPLDPADEATCLITRSPSHVLELNHYLFADRRDFVQPFHALAIVDGRRTAGAIC
jgi:hypothetical protein